MMSAIDGHIHYLLRENEEQTMLDGMDAAGVAHSVLVPLPHMRFLNACTGDNDEVVALAARHADRFAFVVYLDPREESACDTLRRHADRGAVGIKLFPPVGYYPDDDRCMPVYEAAAELGLPVLSHTGGTSMTYWNERPRVATGTHWADPIRFDRLARTFPEITWILAHMGMPWCHNAWFTSAVNGNVYLDISGGRHWMKPLPDLRRSFGDGFAIDFKRVIWGSDNCLPPDEHIVFTKQLLGELECPEPDHPAVFGATAREVFRL
jgi:predicted TIM-barrel fold metal-dependent hydrolase